jgi:serine/threonine-protein kinase
MTEDPQPANRLEELLATWYQERAERGREIPPEELCIDCPELRPELCRRLQVLRRFEALLTPDGEVGETVSWSAGAEEGAETLPVPPGYELLGRIGAGGMGVVMRARRIDLNRVEALKMIRAGALAGPREVARFRFEAEAAAALDHPNIVTVYGVGEVGGLPYLALRWIDGVSLAERLRAAPCPPRQAAELMEKVARAVHYAHQRGILHRDLKPANILLDRSGEPYVSDFGLARRLDATQALTEFGDVVGTPAYMSPEQARGERNPTAATDVYALGVTLYEALTGRRPFLGKTHFEVLKQVVEAEPPEPRSLNPTLDPALEAICLKCLKKVPGERYATALELADDLERYLNGQAVAAHLPGFWDWLGQMLRTRPEPNLRYSWEVTAAFGAIILVTNVALFEMARQEAPAIAVWGVNLLSGLTMGMVLWWYMLRRFRHLPVTERHSLIIAAGHILVMLALTLAYVPLSFTASAREVLAMYPAMAGCSGLGLFVLGSTNWSRFFLLGLGVIALVPVLAWWPEWSPLVYGGVTAAVMWYWAWSKKGFSPKEGLAG